MPEESQSSHDSSPHSPDGDQTYVHTKTGEPLVETADLAELRLQFEAEMRRIGATIRPGASDGDRATYFSILNGLGNSSTEAEYSSEAELFRTVYEYRGLKRTTLRDRHALISQQTGAEVGTPSPTYQKLTSLILPELSTTTSEEQGFLDRDFSTLMFIGRLNSIFGWALVALCLAAGVLLVGMSVALEDHKLAGILAAVAATLGATLLALIVVASGQVITCFVSIERNTRDTAILQKRQLDALTKGPPSEQ